MRDMLVDDPQAIVPGRHDETLMQLAEQLQAAKVHQARGLQVDQRRPAMAAIGLLGRFRQARSGADGVLRGRPIGRGRRNAGRKLLAAGEVEAPRPGRRRPRGERPIRLPGSRRGFGPAREALEFLRSGPGGQRERRGRFRFDQPGADRIPDERENSARIAETDLGLRRMHVDVDFFRRQFEEQEAEGIRALRHQVLVRAGNRPLDQAVADKAPVRENEDGVAIQALRLGLGGESAKAKGRPLHRFDLDEPGQGVAPEDLVDALPGGLDRGDVQQGPMLVPQAQRFVEMGQAVVRRDPNQMREFGFHGPQEFPPGRHVVEQVPHCDAGARRQGLFAHVPHPAAADFDNRARRLVRRPRPQGDPRHAGDRRQGFAAESKRADREQILRLPEFARRVALESQHGVIAAHARTVVGNLDQAPAAGLQVNPHLGRGRVERVLDQFLADGGGPLDHFAGGDLVGDLVGEDADAAHGCL